MLVKFQAGAEVDIATGAELAGAAKDIINGSRSPNPIRLSYAGSSPAAQNYLDIGHPPVSKTWKIVSMTLLGVDAFTTVASGLAALFFGDEANPGLSQCRVPAITVPSWNKANGELWVHSTEQVFFLLNAQATAVPVTAVVCIEEWNESDVTATFNRYSSV